MVAPRVRLARVIATVLNPFSDFHLVVDRYRSPVQFACGRTRPLTEVDHWVDEDPAHAPALTEIDGVPVCRQCRRSAGWTVTREAGTSVSPADALAVSAAGRP